MDGSPGKRRPRLRTLIPLWCLLGAPAASGASGASGEDLLSLPLEELARVELDALARTPATAGSDAVVIPARTPDLPGCPRAEVRKGSQEQPACRGGFVTGSR